MGDDPYKAQTEHNTSPQWLADQTPLDVHVDGVLEYATDVVAIHKNLISHTGYVGSIASLVPEAWPGGVLPEAAIAGQRILSNFNEFRAYFQQLSFALNNIGMAAQTVADSYSSTDIESAASLNAVKFAFGVPGATRPAGLSPFVGNTTWQDQVDKIQAEQAGGGDAPTSKTDTTMNGPHQTVTTTTDANGQKTVTTTTQYQLDGRPVTATETTVGGKTTSFTTVTTSPTAGGGHVQTRATYDGRGIMTSKTVETTQPDGSRNTTTTAYPKGKPKVTQDVSVGPETPKPGMPTSPAAAALKELAN